MRMRLIIVAICFLAFAKALPQSVISQDSIIVKNEEPTAVEAVKKFFKSFHAKDTIALKNSMFAETKITSLSITDGEKKISSSTNSDFLQKIAAIPDSVTFEERLIEIRYISDKHIATVSTTYEFYYNQQFTHAGNNIFTLILIDNKWLIVSITDTRIYN